MKIREMNPSDPDAQTIEIALGLIQQTEDAALEISPKGETPRRVAVATPGGLAIADANWDSETHGRLPAPMLELSFTPWREVRTMPAVKVPAVGAPTVSVTVSTAFGDIFTESPTGSARRSFDDMLRLLLDRSAGVSRS